MLLLLEEVLPVVFTVLDEAVDELMLLVLDDVLLSG